MGPVNRAKLSSNSDSIRKLYLHGAHQVRSVCTGVPSGRTKAISIPSLIAFAMLASWPSVRLRCPLRPRQGRRGDAEALRDLDLGEPSANVRP